MDILTPDRVWGKTTWRRLFRNTGIASNNLESLGPRLLAVLWRSDGLR